MYKLPLDSKEALDDFWLCVWHSLVEQYWDFILDNQNNPYTFSAMRQRGNTHIDEDIESLANNFWERNRADLKEYFVNYTCDFWPNKECAVHKDVNCGGWMDCGVDPAFPDRHHNDNSAFSVERLVSTNWFARTIEQSMKAAEKKVLDLKMKKFLDESKRLDIKDKEERRRLRIQYMQLWKNRICRFLGLSFLVK